MRRLSLLCIALGFIGATQADEYALNADARSVPLPSAASSELQEAISQWPVPDVAASRNAPATTAEWLAVIEPNDQARAKSVQRAIEQRSVEVQQVEFAGVNVYRVTPARISPAGEQRIFVFLHGGAYVFGQGRGGLGEAILIADRIGIQVISIDYRMPPSDPFPAALDDAVAVYRELIESQSPQSIALGGTSAGGGLALATVHRFRDLDLPLPGAIYAGTPWSDITKTGDTLFTNEGLDRVLVTYDGLLGAAARLYAGDHDLKNPLLSPVYGDFDGFPPTILVTGTRDMFLSDVARTHRKLRAAGVTADLHVYEGMSHAGYLLPADTPESRDMYGEVGAFIAKHLK